ncbi:MAG: alpha/beta hydrolase [Phycisphaerales bacterium JB038]
MHDWTLKGAGEQLIRGSVDRPGGEPECVILFGHGFKGYKDYGFIPVLGDRLAQAGCLVHRFNFSHSGMGEGIETFEHPKLFEEDTWNKQVEDLTILLRAVRHGDLPDTPTDLPIVLLGHSRGGVSCLLTAGRMFRDGAEPTPAAVCTMSTPHEACSLGSGDQKALLAEGRLRSPSARTGQDLYVGQAWLREQIEQPEEHHVVELCGYITAPVLAVHGKLDPTVPYHSADRIAGACPDGASALIDGADHVYNTKNPAAVAAAPSPELATLIEQVREFINEKARV